MDTVQARKHMVDSQVRPNDVPDLRLQSAMSEIPREAFVPTNRRNLAYVEKDVPLFEGRYLLKARDFAKLVHSLNLKSDDLVLDVGCGYGYSSAVMARLVSVVVGLESDEEAADKASQNFSEFGIDNAAMVQGELPAGCERQGPYDAILIAGGVQGHLDTLLSQLKPEGGRLATIVMEGTLGHATLFTRSHDAIGRRRLFEAYPSSILPGFNLSAGFVF
jgi:protein-L-isoaspartate(D-aspartate) O-methyltransferase